MTPDDVRRQNSQKIVTFCSCVYEIVKLFEKQGTSFVELAIRALVVDDNAIRYLKNNPQIIHTRAMNIDVEETRIFLEGLQKVECKLTKN